MSPSIQDRVTRFVESVSPEPSCWVVAVSGGADSVALTLALAPLQRAGRITNLVMAHLNHQLRGADSDTDEAFVIDLAHGLGIVCKTHRLDVIRLSEEQGESLEKTAREARYGWLADVARAENAAFVATGHTADDQAETVLHRLLRGTGLHGLQGIPASRRLVAGIDVVRPLLTSTRAEVLAFLQAAKQPFREDSSNADRIFTRNRIRHELLPELARTYNPAIVSILCRLAAQAREVQTDVETEATNLLKEAELPRAGDMLIFDAGRLASARRNPVREMFRLIWLREDWPTGAMTFDHWDRLAALAHVQEEVFDLPEGVRARRQGRVIQLVRNQLPSSKSITQQPRT